MKKKLKGLGLVGNRLEKILNTVDKYCDHKGSCTMSMHAVHRCGILLPAHYEILYKEHDTLLQTPRGKNLLMTF